MNKYVRLTNSARLQNDIEVLKKYFSTRDEDRAIKYALQLFLYEHEADYQFVPGDIDECIYRN